MSRILRLRPARRLRALSRRWQCGPTVLAGA